METTILSSLIHEGRRMRGMVSPWRARKEGRREKGEKDVPPTDSPALALTITNSPTC